MPENYKRPGPEDYRRPAPENHRRPASRDYRRPEPEYNGRPASRDYRRAGPGDYRRPAPDSYGRPGPQDYRRGPVPGDYRRREPASGERRRPESSRPESSRPENNGPRAKIRRLPRRWGLVLAAVLVLAAAGVGYAVYPRPAPVPVVPVRDYAGGLVLNASGSQLASWNQTSNYCPSNDGIVGDGTVATSSGGVTLTTTGKSGSCVALISPDMYSSGVIEADIDFPALPGKPGTIANWTSFWMTDGATWPKSGEIDAAEAEPVNGKNAVSWHSGSSSNEFSASTDGFFPTKLPIDGPNLTPGWHTVDIVYTKGFFAVYYDGKRFSFYKSSNVTGAALNILLTTSVTPDTQAERQNIGGPPVNSDSSPATLTVKYVRVWSYK